MNLGALWCPGVGSVHVFYHLTYVPDIVWFYFDLHSPVVLTSYRFLYIRSFLAPPLTVYHVEDRCAMPVLSNFPGP